MTAALRGVSNRWLTHRQTTDRLRPEIPPLTARLGLLRGSLVVIALISGAFLLQLLVVSMLQQRSSQQELFDSFREHLALGTAPIGPTDIHGREVAVGTPVAYLEVPAIGLRQVVVEGTTSSALYSGPGHRRDTPLPGQIGVSVLIGRRATYGGPFGDLGRLAPGDEIVVTTAQGKFEYRVLGTRAEGDPLPPPMTSGGSRMVLTTADGPPLLPEGLLRVDAEITGEPVIGPGRLVSATALPASEQAMGADTGRLWALALWLQALIAVATAGIWAWHRWGHSQAWVVFLPAFAFVALQVAGEAARLLPNVL